MASDNSSKLFALTAFLMFDLVLNSFVDYDYFNYQISLGLSGLQIVIQIAIFLILFLGFADTYLFRVGLIGYLLRKFQGTLLIHPIYFLITIADLALRLNLYGKNNATTALVLWENSSFITLSYVQKFVAIPYYLLNIRAMLEMGSPMFSKPGSWIEIVKSS